MANEPTYMYRLSWKDSYTGKDMWGRWYKAEKLTELEDARDKAVKLTNQQVEVDRTIYNEYNLLRSVAEFGMYVEATNAKIELDTRFM